LGAPCGKSRPKDSLEICPDFTWRSAEVGVEYAAMRASPLVEAAERLARTGMSLPGVCEGRGEDPFLAPSLLPVAARSGFRMS
jgi:hypothetical protein